MSQPSDIDWTNPAAPRSRVYGDVYFSLEDGLAESRAVFLTGCGLPEAWAGRRHFTVAELGFGTGLNIAALLTLWRQTALAEARLSVFSIEAHPLDAADAARALAGRPEIAEAAAALTSDWPSRTPGFHRIDLPDWRATLDLAVGDAAWALEQWGGYADAWFLDGFAPSTNPAMWSDAVLDGVRARSAPGARVATFTVAGAVRRGLAERGFDVDKRPGHGRKRERLEARLPKADADDAPPPSVMILGAGIAGASLARALKTQGVRPTVIAPDDGDMASDFRAALVTPRFDLGDPGVAALNAQALERAGQFYDPVEGAVLERGVTRLERDPKDARRFDAIAAQALWPADVIQRLTGEEIRARLGATKADGGLMMADALAVRPARVRQAWLADVDRIAAAVDRIEQQEDGRWAVIDADGRRIAQSEALIVAGGWGAADLLPGLDLRASRGQVSWAPIDAAPPAVTWGGYAVGVDNGLLFGATHQRGRTDTVPVPEDDTANLATLAGVLPDIAVRAAEHPSQGQAAVRATTADHLPVCGELQPGLWILGGLGSRGFLMAPLLAEHVAAAIAGRPGPLPAALAKRVDPMRFT